MMRPTLEERREHREKAEHHVHDDVHADVHVHALLRLRIHGLSSVGRRKPTAGKGEAAECGLPVFFPR